MDTSYKNVFVLGQTGVGKSYFLNMLLGHDGDGDSSHCFKVALHLYLKTADDGTVSCTSQCDM
jgi:ABC-type lipoprotein export system ATPase subunit